MQLGQIREGGGNAQPFGEFRRGQSQGRSGLRGGKTDTAGHGTRHLLHTGRRRRGIVFREDASDVVQTENGFDT